MLTVCPGTPICHTVMIVVNTQGEVLSRSRRFDQFSRIGCGGGKWPKGFLHCHFACREGVQDEFGISFHNPAVLAVSEPLIHLRNPEKDMQWYCKQLQGTWVQVMVIDHKQIKFTSHNGHWGAQGTRTPFQQSGQWGHWEVGGEPLWCNEVDGGRGATEALGHGGVQFCWEDLDRISNFKLPNTHHKLWRDVDFNTLVFYRSYIKKFITDVAGDRRIRGHVPVGCGQVQIAENT